jgi:hypothetical protein
MVAAVACLGSGEAEAQYRRRYVARDLRAEAQLAAYIAQLNALTAQERARQAAARWAAGRQRVLPPGTIPVNIPVNTPMYGPLTLGQQIANQTVAGQLLGSARAGCIARQASQPYDRFGRMNHGWYDTVLGPRPTGC